MISKTQPQFDILLISERGHELCSGGSYSSESEALLNVSRAMSGLPTTASWEIVRTSREVVKRGKGPPTNQEIIAARSR